MKLKSRWVSGAVLGGLLTGCISAGPMSSGTSSGPPSRGFREFYVGPGITQYFLLPQRLPATTERYAELDLVVRDSVAVPYYALLHVSVVEAAGPSTSAAFGPADTLLLSTNGISSPVTKVKVLFSENAGKTRLTRLEALLPPAQVVAYLHSPNHSLLIGRPGSGRMLYQPDKKAAGYLKAFAATVAPAPN